MSQQSKAAVVLEYIFATISNLIFACGWAAIAWWFTNSVGAPHWASWAVAFLSFDAQINISHTSRLVRKAVAR